MGEPSVQNHFLFTLLSHTDVLELGGDYGQNVFMKSAADRENPATHTFTNVQIQALERLPDLLAGTGTELGYVKSSDTQFTLTVAQDDAGLANLAVGTTYKVRFEEAYTDENVTGSSAALATLASKSEPDADNADKVTLTFTGTAADDPEGVYIIANDVPQRKVQEIAELVATPLDVNEAPHTITLGGTTTESRSVAENVESADLGVLGVSDPDAGDTITFSIASTGDHASFDLETSEDSGTTATHLTMSSQDYETLTAQSKNPLSVTVVATDADGLFVSKTFAVTITDVTNPTPAPQLSSSTVNVLQTAFVGLLSTAANNTFEIYSASDSTSADSDQFEIETVGSGAAAVHKLKLKDSARSAQIATPSATLTARVRTKATNAGESVPSDWVDFVITIDTTNSAPFDLKLDDGTDTTANFTVKEHDDDNLVVGVLSAYNYEKEDSITFTLDEDSQERFEIADDPKTEEESISPATDDLPKKYKHTQTLKLRAALDYEAEDPPSYSVAVTAKDAADHEINQTFTVTLLDTRITPRTMDVDEKTPGAEVEQLRYKGQKTREMGANFALHTMTDTFEIVGKGTDDMAVTRIAALVDDNGAIQSLEVRKKTGSLAWTGAADAATRYAAKAVALPSLALAPAIATAGGELHLPRTSMSDHYPADPTQYPMLLNANDDLDSTRIASYGHAESVVRTVAENGDASLSFGGGLADLAATQDATDANSFALTPNKQYTLGFDVFALFSAAGAEYRLGDTSESGLSAWKTQLDEKTGLGMSEINVLVQHADAFRAQCRTQISEDLLAAHGNDNLFQGAPDGAAYAHTAAEMQQQLEANAGIVYIRFTTDGTETISAATVGGESVLQLKRDSAVVRTWTPTWSIEPAANQRFELRDGATDVNASVAVVDYARSEGGRHVFTAATGSALPAGPLNQVEVRERAFPATATASVQFIELGAQEYVTAVEYSLNADASALAYLRIATNNPLNSLTIGTAPADPADAPASLSIPAGQMLTGFDTAVSFPTLQALTDHTLGAVLRLKQGTQLEYSVATSYTLRVSATDVVDGVEHFEQITVNVNSVNQAPTALKFSNNALFANVYAGREDALVGYLVGTDPDADVDGADPDYSTVTFTLVNGVEDNGKFEIVYTHAQNSYGPTLVTNGTLSDAAGTELTVRVRVTDGGGLYFEQDLTITVQSLPQDSPEKIHLINDAPTDINIAPSYDSSADVSHPTTVFAPVGVVGHVVATLSMVDGSDDPDLDTSANALPGGDSHTFSITPAANAVGYFQDRFEIVGNELRIKVALQWDEYPNNDNEYKVKVRVTDKAHNTYDERITVRAYRIPTVSIAGPSADQAGGFAHTREPQTVTATVDHALETGSNAVLLTGVTMDGEIVPSDATTTYDLSGITYRLNLKLRNNQSSSWGWKTNYNSVIEELADLASTTPGMERMVVDVGAQTITVPRFTFQPEDGTDGVVLRPAVGDLVPITGFDNVAAHISEDRSSIVIPDVALSKYAADGGHTFRFSFTQGPESNSVSFEADSTVALDRQQTLEYELVAVEQALETHHGLEIDLATDANPDGTHTGLDMAVMIGQIKTTRNEARQTFITALLALDADTTDDVSITIGTDASDADIVTAMQTYIRTELEVLKTIPGVSALFTEGDPLSGATLKAKVQEAVENMERGTIATALQGLEWIDSVDATSASTIADDVRGVLNQVESAFTTELGEVDGVAVTDYAIAVAGDNAADRKTSITAQVQQVLTLRAAAVADNFRDAIRDAGITTVDATGVDATNIETKVQAALDNRRVEVAKALNALTLKDDAGNDLLDANADPIRPFDIATDSVSSATFIADLQTAVDAAKDAEADARRRALATQINGDAEIAALFDAGATPFNGTDSQWVTDITDALTAARAAERGVIATELKSVRGADDADAEIVSIGDNPSAADIHDAVQSAVSLLRSEVATALHSVEGLQVYTAEEFATISPLASHTSGTDSATIDRQARFGVQHSPWQMVSVPAGNTTDIYSISVNIGDDTDADWMIHVYDSDSWSDSAIKHKFSKVNNNSPQSFWKFYDDTWNGQNLSDHKRWLATSQTTKAGTTAEGGTTMTKFVFTPPIPAGSIINNKFWFEIQSTTGSSPSNMRVWYTPGVEMTYPLPSTVDGYAGATDRYEYYSGIPATLNYVVNEPPDTVVVKSAAEIKAAVETAKDGSGGWIATAVTGAKEEFVGYLTETGDNARVPTLTIASGTVTNESAWSAIADAIETAASNAVTTRRGVLVTELGTMGVLNQPDNAVDISALTDAQIATKIEEMVAVAELVAADEKRTALTTVLRGISDLQINTEWANDASADRTKLTDANIEERVRSALERLRDEHRQETEAAETAATQDQATAVSGAIEASVDSVRAELRKLGVIIRGDADAADDLNSIETLIRAKRSTLASMLNDIPNISIDPLTAPTDAQLEASIKASIEKQRADLLDLLDPPSTPAAIEFTAADPAAAESSSEQEVPDLTLAAERGWFGNIGGTYEMYSAYTDEGERLNRWYKESQFGPLIYYNGQFNGAPIWFKDEFEQNGGNPSGGYNGAYLWWAIRDGVGRWELTPDHPFRAQYGYQNTVPLTNYTNAYFYAANGNIESPLTVTNWVGKFAGHAGKSMTLTGPPPPPQKYVVGGESQGDVALARGTAYTISYPADHPLALSTTQDGTHGDGGVEWTAGVVRDEANSELTVTLPYHTPDALYYYCAQHAGMGGKINVGGIAGLTINRTTPEEARDDANIFAQLQNAVRAASNVAREDVVKYLNQHSAETGVTFADTAGDSADFLGDLNTAFAAQRSLMLTKLATAGVHIAVAVADDAQNSKSATLDAVVAEVRRAFHAKREALVGTLDEVVDTVPTGDAIHDDDALKNAIKDTLVRQRKDLLEMLVGVDAETGEPNVPGLTIDNALSDETAQAAITAALTAYYEQKRETLGGELITTLARIDDFTVNLDGVPEDAVVTKAVTDALLKQRKDLVDALNLVAEKYSGASDAFAIAISGDVLSNSNVVGEIGNALEKQRETLRDTLDAIDGVELPKPTAENGASMSDADFEAAVLKAIDDSRDGLRAAMSDIVTIPEGSATDEAFAAIVRDFVDGIRSNHQQAFSTAASDASQALSGQAQAHTDALTEHVRVLKQAMVDRGYTIDVTPNGSGDVDDQLYQVAHQALLEQRRVLVDSLKAEPLNMTVDDSTDIVGAVELALGKQRRAFAKSLNSIAGITITVPPEANAPAVLDTIKSEIAQRFVEQRDIILESIGTIPGIEVNPNLISTSSEDRVFSAEASAAANAAVAAVRAGLLTLRADIITALNDVPGVKVDITNAAVLADTQQTTREEYTAALAANISDKLEKSLENLVGELNTISIDNFEGQSVQVQITSLPELDSNTGEPTTLAQRYDNIRGAIRTALNDQKAENKKAQRAELVAKLNSIKFERADGTPYYPIVISGATYAGAMDVQRVHDAVESALELERRDIADAVASADIDIAAFPGDTVPTNAAIKAAVEDVIRKKRERVYQVIGSTITDANNTDSALTAAVGDAIENASEAKREALVFELNKINGIQLPDDATEANVLNGVRAYANKFVKHLTDAQLTVKFSLGATAWSVSDRFELEKMTAPNQWEVIAGPVQQSDPTTNGQGLVSRYVENEKDTVFVSFNTTLEPGARVRLRNRTNNKGWVNVQ